MTKADAVVLLGAAETLRQNCDNTPSCWECLMFDDEAGCAITSEHPPREWALEYVAKNMAMEFEGAEDDDKSRKAPGDE